MVFCKGHFCYSQVGTTSCLWMGRPKSRVSLKSKTPCPRKKQSPPWRWLGGGERGFCLDFGHWAVTEGLPFQIYISSLEEEFNHFEDWLNVFLCTKGMGARMEMERKKGLDPLWASSRSVWGKKGSTGGDAGGKLSYQGLFWLPDSRAPSFTLHQRQCHSLSSWFPRRSHRTSRQTPGQSKCGKGECGHLACLPLLQR